MKVGAAVVRSIVVGALSMGCSTNGPLTLAVSDGSASEYDAGDAAPIDASDAGESKRGFPASDPWLSFYGNATQMNDLARAASTFRIINLDADPDVANFNDAQISMLRGGGSNRVISYLNVGSCEKFRSYWATAPAFKSCSENVAAQIGPYAGYPDEVWMNVGNADYQALVVDYVAARLAKRGIDGFFLDNLEVVEHGTSTTNGPCDAACAQGGLDLVRKLREKFPDMLIVMQNATSDFTRLGKTGGIDFPTLLDGISHEEVYQPSYDAQAEAQMKKWSLMELRPGGRTFFIGTEDYVQSCANTTAAKSAYVASRTSGFSPYATDQSSGQKVVCYWPF